MPFVLGELIFHVISVLTDDFIIDIFKLTDFLRVPPTGRWKRTNVSTAHNKVYGKIYWMTLSPRTFLTYFHYDIRVT